MKLKLECEQEDCAVTQEPASTDQGEASDYASSPSNPAERREMVVRMAIELASAGEPKVTAEEIMLALDEASVTLGIARPTTMIGAVLSAHDDFERVGKGEFRYTGENATDDAVASDGIEVDVQKLAGQIGNTGNVYVLPADGGQAVTQARGWLSKRSDHAELVGVAAGQVAQVWLYRGPDTRPKYVERFRYAEPEHCGIPGVDTATGKDRSIVETEWLRFEDYATFGQREDTAVHGDG